MVLDTIIAAGVQERTTFQSFDLECLRIANRLQPKQTLALLIDEGQTDFEKNIKELGFQPPIYSPYYPLVTRELMAFATEKNMKVIPWTVNEVEDMINLTDLGVDGIITDYPDRLIALQKLN